MYSKVEKPTLSATIYYYDIEYNQETAYNVLEILKKYNMYLPEKIYADKLTKGKFVSVENGIDNLFIQAYSEKDVFEVDMASGDSRKVDDYWRVDWSFTYYKNRKLVGACSLMPWNNLTVQSTYGRLQNHTNYDEFISCVKELIVVLDPFYASIDDVNNKVELLSKAGEAHFVPERVQEIFWGNYFGKIHCDNFGIEKMLEIPTEEMERIGEGVFFTLTKSALDFGTKEAIEARKKVKQILKFKKQTIPFILKNGWNWV